MSDYFRIDVDALKALAAPVDQSPDVSDINFALLDMLELWAEREWAKKEAGLPSEWDQSKWLTVAGAERTGTACGTAACLAGKAILTTPGVTFTEWENSAYQPIVDFSAYSQGRTFDNVLVPAAMVSNPAKYTLDEGYKQEVNGQQYYEMYASKAGQILLGLNAREADKLFDGFNDLARVKAIMADIRKGEYRKVSRSSRQEVPVVEVSVNSTPLCEKSAQEYVNEIVGGSGTSFYSLYGRCTNLAGHAEGEHTFQYT